MFIRTTVVFFILFIAKIIIGKEVEISLPEVIIRYEQMLIQSPGEGISFDKVYQHFFTLGELEKLEKRWTEAISKQPDKTSTYKLLLGMLWERSGKLALAKKNYLEALKNDSENHSLHIALGKLLIKQSDLNGAIEHLKRTLTLKLPPVVYQEVSLDLARVQQRNLDFNGALETFKTLHAAFPNDEIIIEETAEALVDGQQYDEALAAYKKLELVSTNNLQKKLYAITKQGELEEQRGNINNAIEIYSSILDNSHSESWIYNDISFRIEEIHRLRDDLSSLTEFYVSRISKRPKDITSILKLSTVLLDSDKKNEALNWLNKGLALAPGNLEMYILKAEILLQKSEYNKAADIYSDLVNLHPENWQYREKQGAVYWRQFEESQKEEYKNKALLIWKKLVHDGTESIEQKLRLADLFREHQLDDQAIKLNFEVLQSSPDLVDLRERFALYLFTLNKNDKAWKVLEDGKKYNPTPDFFLRLGNLYKQYQKTENALVTYELGLEIDRANFNLLNSKWRLLMDLEKWQDAEKLFATLSASAPNEFVLDEIEDRYVWLIRMMGDEHYQQKRLKFLESIENSITLSEQDFRIIIKMVIDDNIPSLADKIFSKAKEIYPESFGIAHLETKHWQRFGSIDQQVKSWRKLIQLNPLRKVEWMKQIIHVYKSGGLTEMALKTVEEFIQQYPVDPQAHLLYAELCYNSNLIEKGNEALLRVLNLSENSFDVRIRLAQAMIEQGNYESAGMHYKIAFNDADNFSMRKGLIEPLVEIHLTEGRLNELLLWFKHNQKRRLAETEYSVLMSEIHSSSGDYSNARKALSDNLNRKRNDPELLKKLFQLAKEESNFSEQLKYSRKLAQLKPTPQNEIQLASVLIEAGEVQEALVLFEKNIKSVMQNFDNWLKVCAGFLEYGYGEKISNLLEQEIKNNKYDWRSKLLLAEFFIIQKNDSEAENLLWNIFNIDVEIIPPGNSITNNLNIQNIKNTPQHQQKLQAGMRARQAYQQLLQLRTDPQAVNKNSNYGIQISNMDLSQGQITSLVYLAGIAAMSNKVDDFVSKLKTTLNRMETPTTGKILAFLMVRARHALLDEIKIMLDDEIYDSEITPFCHLVLTNTMNAGYAVGEDFKRMDLLTERLEKTIITKEPFKANQLLLNKSRQLQGNINSAKVKNIVKENFDQLNWKDAKVCFSVAKVFLHNNDFKQAKDAIKKGINVLSARSNKDNRILGLNTIIPYTKVLLKNQEHIDDDLILITKILATRYFDKASASLIKHNNSRNNLTQYFDKPHPNRYFDHEDIVIIRQLYNMLRQSDIQTKFLRNLDMQADKLFKTEKVYPLMIRFYFYWWDDNISSAWTALEKIINIEINDDIRLMAAEVLSAQKNFKEAQLYLKDIKNDIGNFGIVKLAKLTSNSMDLGEVESARETAQKLVSMRAVNVPQFNFNKALNNLGLNFSSNPNAKNKNLSVTNSRDWPEYRNLLNNYVREKRLEDIESLAKKILMKVTTRNIGNQPPWIRNEALKKLYQINQLDKYILEIKRQLNVSSESIRLNYLLAEAYQVKSSINGSTIPELELLYKKLIKLKPGNLYYQTLLSQYFLKTNNFSELTKTFQQQLEKDIFSTLQKNPSIVDAYVKAKKIDEFVKLILDIKFPPLSTSRLNNFSARNSSAIKQIGTQLNKNGFKKEASQIWMKALRSIDAQYSFNIAEALLMEVRDTLSTNDKVEIITKIFLPDEPVGREALWMQRQFKGQFPFWLFHGIGSNQSMLLNSIRLLKLVDDKRVYDLILKNAADELLKGENGQFISARALTTLVQLLIQDKETPDNLLAWVNELNDNSSAQSLYYRNELCKNFIPVVVDKILTWQNVEDKCLKLLNIAKAEIDSESENFHRQAAIRKQIFRVAKLFKNDQLVNSILIEWGNIYRLQSIHNTGNMDLEGAYQLLRAMLDVKMLNEAKELLENAKRSARQLNNSNYLNRYNSLEDQLAIIEGKLEFIFPKVWINPSDTLEQSMSVGWEFGATKAEFDIQSKNQSLIVYDKEIHNQDESFDLILQVSKSRDNFKIISKIEHSKFSGFTEITSKLPYGFIKGNIIDRNNLEIIHEGISQFFLNAPNLIFNPEFISTDTNNFENESNYGWSHQKEILLSTNGGPTKDKKFIRIDTEGNRQIILTGKKILIDSKSDYYQFGWMRVHENSHAYFGRRYLDKDGNTLSNKYCNRLAPLPGWNLSSQILISSDRTFPNSERMHYSAVYIQPIFTIRGKVDIDGIYFGKIPVDLE